MRLSNMKYLLFSALLAPLAITAPVDSGTEWPGDWAPAPVPLETSDFVKTPLSVFRRVLMIQTDPDFTVLKDLVSYDCTYISLTPENPTLHAIMPWAGTHQNVGPQAFIDIFTRVGLYWNRGPFTIDSIFGDDTGNVTAWGSFTATSRTLGKTVISPWSARAVVNEENKITYFQWMEDTFTTGSSFWADNTTKLYIANPMGGRFEA